MYSDGAGLYAQVDTESCSWLFRYDFRGRSRYMGLGGMRDVSLAQARAKVAEYRRQKANGQDPLELRRQECAQRELDAASRAVRRLVTVPNNQQPVMLAGHPAVGAVGHLSNHGNRHCHVHPYP